MEKSMQQMGTRGTAIGKWGSREHLELRDVQR